MLRLVVTTTTTTATHAYRRSGEIVATHRM